MTRVCIGRYKERDVNVWCQHLTGKDGFDTITGLLVIFLPLFDRKTKNENYHMNGTFNFFAMAFRCLKSVQRLLENN